VTLPDSADAVLPPDGTRDPASSGAYPVTGTPGIYHVARGADTIGAFAVNPVATESDLTRLSARDVRARLGDADVTTVDDADEWPGAVYRQRLGAESWRPFAVLALIVLLLESLLAASGRASRQRGTGAAPPPDMRPQPGTAD
jgi:hypothetical protein